MVRLAARSLGARLLASPSTGSRLRWSITLHGLDLARCTRLPTRAGRRSGLRDRRIFSARVVVLFLACKRSRFFVLARLRIGGDRRLASGLGREDVHGPALCGRRGLRWSARALRSEGGQETSLRGLGRGRFFCGVRSKRLGRTRRCRRSGQPGGGCFCGGTCLAQEVSTYR